MDLTNLNKDREKGKARKCGNIDTTTMVYGKIPPQATELEAAILGALMLDKTAIDLVYDKIRPECFYLDAHQRIFAAIMKLNEKSQPVDILTVTEQLKSSEELDIVGGPYFVTRLTNSVVSSANIEPWSMIIMQKFISREMIRISGETISTCYEDTTDVFEMLEQHEKQYTDLISGSFKKSIVASDTAVVEELQRLEERRKRSEFITGVPSGFSGLDKITHGWQKTDLIILAARPAVGKTAFALQLARNASMNSVKPVPVALYSLEMSRGQLTQRNLSAESGIWLDNIARGNLDEEQMKVLYQKAVTKLASARIFIDDSAALNIYELKASCRRMKRMWKRLYGTDDGLIILDYLQLMSGMSERSGNREQEISQISRGR